MHFDSYCPTYMLVLLCYAALHFQLETWYKLQILIHSASTDMFPPCFSKHAMQLLLLNNFLILGCFPQEMLTCRQSTW